MKTCPSCTESYNPEAQFYSTGEQEVCGACHDDWEDEQKEKAEERRQSWAEWEVRDGERASLANLEVPDEFDPETALATTPQLPGIADDNDGMPVDDTCAVEGADLRRFDVDAALAGMTNAQASKLLELVHDVDGLEEENAQAVGEIVAGAIDGVRLVMGGGK